MAVKPWDLALSVEEFYLLPPPRIQTWLEWWHISACSALQKLICYQTPIFLMAVSYLSSATEASCSQAISQMMWTRQQSLNWARFVLGLAAQPSLVVGQTKMLPYPSICCLNGHFATAGFCNFSFNISFLLIRNPTFFFPCEVREKKGSQTCVE